MTLNYLEHWNRGFYGFYTCSQWASIHALLSRVPFVLAGLSCFIYFRIFKVTAASGFLGALECTKCFRPGHRPGPAGGIYSAPPDPLTGLRGKGKETEGKGRGREGERKERGRG